MTTTNVTVLGLGSMGSTLARLLAAQGRGVTAWNRTPGKADALAPAGVRAAATAARAVAASPVVLVCVSDHRAARAFLDAPDVAEALRGQVLVQLSTIGPEDALQADAWMRSLGGRFLSAAIQAAPSQMGRDDTPILVSGDASAWREAEPVLRVLGGQLIHLGEAPDAAATMDLATLSYVYGAFAGFAHGALMAQAKGLDVAAYGRIVRAISPSFGDFFAHEGQVIQSGDFRVTESPLRISIEATARILRHSQAAGLNTEVPALLAGLLAKAEAAGLADEEVAAVVKVLRPAAR